MAKQKLTWNLFIKLIIYIVLLFVGWGLGSNLVYLAGRSKLNKYNNYADGYNPGFFDWPFNKHYMPYSNKDPLNSNLENPEAEKFEKVHSQLHKQEEKQTGGGSSWSNLSRKKFNKMGSLSRKRRSKDE